MQAVRFHGIKDLRVEKLPVPECGKGQVRVKPAWCGICGSDLHEYLGGPNICPTTPHPLTGEKVPLTFGHEFSGIVESIGEGVTKFKTGDRVCVQPIIYDGTCGACHEGLINCCYSGGFIGLSGWGGGLSEYVVAPEASIYKVPDNVSLEVAALVEPLAVGWHAVNVSTFQPGQSALILGSGPIGLSTILALKARGGNGLIIVSEVSSQRKSFAKSFGADVILDPTSDDIVARCLELCDNQGVHVVFDCAGVQAGLDQAVQAVRARGTVVNVAIWEKPCSINPNLFCFKERRYQGVATYQAGDFQAVLDAISSGSMKPEGMITKKIKFDEVVEEGFQALIKDKDRQVKILVEAGGADVVGK